MRHIVRRQNVPEVLLLPRRVRCTVETVWCSITRWNRTSETIGTAKGGSPTRSLNTKVEDATSISTNESTANEKTAVRSERRSLDRLLSVQNARTRKGEKPGIVTGILYLSPANESGVRNTCTSSTPECRSARIYTAGRGGFDFVRCGRIRKTRWLARDREGFVEELKRNVTRLIGRPARWG